LRETSELGVVNKTVGSSEANNIAVCYLMFNLLNTITLMTDRQQTAHNRCVIIMKKATTST